MVPIGDSCGCGCVCVCVLLLQAFSSGDDFFRAAAANWLKKPSIADVSPQTIVTAGGAADCAHICWLGT